MTASRSDEGDKARPEPEEDLLMIESRTMLLSSVAEHLYWAGRYLERAEATARLVRTHTELFVDLPKAAGLGWDPLLAITGSAGSFGSGRDDRAAVMEDAVVTFLLADPEHQGSVITSMAMARENLRITRGVIPHRLWEVVNETERWVNATATTGCSRAARIMWTEDVIRRCHTVAGSATATMSRDQAYAFVEIGRLVERADMTSRVLEVAGFTLEGMRGSMAPYSHLAWMSMLRSLGGEQMYRRQLGGMTTSSRAVRFLLRDTTFPRSFEYCLIEISRWLLELPHQSHAMAASVAVQNLLDPIDEDDLDSVDLHRLVDDLQLGLNDLHESLTATYFMSPELATA